MHLLVVLIVVSLSNNAWSQAVPGQQGPFYFDQMKDHTARGGSETFKQKYYSIPGAPDGPVFLYISGEAPLGGFSNDFVIRYAEEFDATLVTLEHRFYGESLLDPSALFTVENLALLTVEQALADLAYFIRDFAAQRPVVTFGCSYAGALSAWFRTAYPSYTVGAISSSGVVEPILDFSQFDLQVSKSVRETDPSCYTLLVAASQALQKAVALNPSPTKAMFNASYFLDSDFLYYAADAVAETVQYGYQDKLCSFLRQDKPILQNYADFANLFYTNVFMGGNITSYARQFLKIETPNGSRAWWWQKCSQLGYFQTAPPTDSLRSSTINLEFYRSICSDVFGAKIWPNVSSVANLYDVDGKYPRGNQIFFLQSSQDPWQWAGVREDYSQNQELTVVCTNCGHCSDFRSCPSLPPIPINSTLGGCADMNVVHRARDETVLTISSWLDAFEKKDQVGNHK